MFGFGKRPVRHDLDARELKAMIDAGEALVVDVREADEFASSHIAGAVNLPLSRFDPARLPIANDKALVLNCAGGRRSAAALEQCAVAHAKVDTHLCGGIAAWKAANLPLVTGA